MNVFCQPCLQNTQPCLHFFSKFVTLFSCSTTKRNLQQGQKVICLGIFNKAISLIGKMAQTIYRYKLLLKQQTQRNRELSELGLECITHRVISDRVHRLLVTLSYFRPDRFVQLLSLIPILILLLYYLVSGCLTSLC